MENNDFKLSETGVNPVNTAGSEKDIYFSNVQSDTESVPTNQNNPPAPRQVKKKKKKGSGLANTYIFFIFVIVASMLLSVYAIMCINDVLAITKTSSNVTITIDEPFDDMDKAIDLLSDNDLIKCKQFCRFFAKFRESQVGPHWRNGMYFKDKTYEPGVYYLNGKMGLEGMLQSFQGNSETAETVTLTFPEGYTIPEIVDRLTSNEVCDKAALLSVIETVDFSYSLVSDKKASENVPYRLEGYLFPDTYEFFVGETATSVVKKFLSNGDTKIKEKYRKRAQELGYSMDEIITIASIIQCEAGNEEQMKVISGVLHNRLKDKANFPTLGVDSTADYITNKVAPALTSTSSHTADYYMPHYNTSGGSTLVGLPASPICNPGMKAIEAALYPEDNDYYYFFHDTKGKMYTARSYSEFKQKIQTYAPYLL